MRWAIESSGFKIINATDGRVVIPQYDQLQKKIHEIVEHSYLPLNGLYDQSVIIEKIGDIINMPIKIFAQLKPASKHNAPINRELRRKYKAYARILFMRVFLF